MIYSSKIKKAVRFPEATKRKVAAFIVRPFVYGSFPERSHIDREWDNLIILDACRFDIFDKNNPFDRIPKPVKSNASHTVGFLKRNFKPEQYDTVYITASPQVVGHESRFHKVIHVWENQWNEELRTVPPENVTNTTLSVKEEYPNKKYVIHYMQPHYPFIGSAGQQLKTHATFTGGLQERKHLSVWELLSSGKISTKEVKTAYKENLEIVMDEVTKLVDKLNGKTIITSDHGNLFGERVSPLPIRIYGHPPNIPAENLIKVPLIELSAESRRKTISSLSKEEKSKSGNVTSRLEDLGYL